MSTTIDSENSHSQTPTPTSPAQIASLIFIHSSLHSHINPPTQLLFIFPSLSVAVAAASEQSPLSSSSCHISRPKPNPTETHSHFWPNSPSSSHLPSFRFTVTAAATSASSSASSFCCYSQSPASLRNPDHARTHARSAPAQNQWRNPNPNPNPTPGTALPNHRAPPAETAAVACICSAALRHTVFSVPTLCYSRSRARKNEKRNAMRMEASSDTKAGAGAGLDPQLWHACAGGMVQMPAVNSLVYYYPQGHAEHAAGPPDFAALRPRPPPAVLCRVVSVRYLADADTDEVYARLRLAPVLDPSAAAAAADASDAGPGPGAGAASADAAAAAAPASSPQSFAKTLTQSDANNGGGFSVPRYCAETIFPRLDYSGEPPVQNVLARDVHGVFWKFRHIYRGTPRRHLLTTGWSTFVNHKKLVAGDSIVFMRTANAELCVGLRRSARLGSDSSVSSVSSVSNSSSSSSSPTAPWGYGGAAGFPGLGFARNRGRVSAHAVVEASARAAAGQAFEVVYYPRAGMPEFCVKAETVRSALGVRWSPGMRFKMAIETEDSARISWFMGTISGVSFADPVLWPSSPWRLLQVTWDEPEILQHKRVSPWLVEVVSTIPHIQMTTYALPKKKLRVTQPPEFQLENQGIMGLHQMGALGSSLLRQMHWQGVSESVSVPAGMQGARQDCVYGISFSDFCANKGPTGLLFANQTHQKEQGSLITNVSTDLNIGNLYQREASEMHSGISCLLSVGSSAGIEQKPGNRQDTNSSKAKGASFLLFGKPIHADQSPKSSDQSVVSDTGDDNASHQGLRNDPFTQGKNDVLQRVHQLISGRKDSPKFCESPLPWLYHGEQMSSTGGIDANCGQWYKDQASMVKLEKDEESSVEDNIVHCKVFKETEEVGRTLDLSLFCTYEQLYDRLGKMFGINESELSNRVLYKGLGGSMRHAGDEPYKDFMKTVRRLTILSDSGSDNMAR